MGGTKDGPLRRKTLKHIVRESEEGPNPSLNGWNGGGEGTRIHSNMGVPRVSYILVYFTTTNKQLKG